ncbi:MAG: pilus assembly protein [Oxalicibacterium faecigallinarum]|uniref:Membrane protein n=1 Tax=Oxalicibacterium faecigallinarum TaxID=573741 RepID=A0A8J3APV6_9BURK|nr:pilus assembly protein [Oxalicibacterium faecigallinarum]MDQ7968442.1 pilus assembly protein [Oxalicibacterium faecigallinarum]GGI18493.1 membrane protein [Oxalicibacterium faecigallinarum]
MKSIAQSLKKSALRQRGQGMTEYIIIVALIAVAAIGVYSMFGQTIRGQVAGLAGEVAGTGATAGKATASTAAGSAATKAAEGKGMSSYDSGNAPSSGSK